MTTGQAIGIEIQKLKNLPPLPLQAQGILRCLGDADVSIENLATELEKIPSLTARLLGVANSAYFGRPGKILTIRDAIIKVLGLSLVKSLSVGLILSARFNTRQCPGFSSRQYWYCAMVTAILTQQFCRLDPQRFADPSIGYTAGLVVNLGMLALVHTFPEAMHEVFVESRESDRKVSIILRDSYEIDQYQMGSWLVKRWQLPSVYQEVIRSQKDVEIDGKNAFLTKLVRRCSDVSYRLFEDGECTDESIRCFADVGIDSETTTEIVDRQRSKIDSLDEMIAALSK